MARNTNQAPVVRRPELEDLQDHVNQIFEALAQGHAELLRRQEILEAAYLSLARNVEDLAEWPDAPGDEELLPPVAKEVWDSDSLEKQFYDPSTALNPETQAAVDEHTVWVEPDESPEEEAARLIAEAEAANEGI